MDNLEISKKTEPVMFTIRIDGELARYYDEVAKETNRSRNEVIAIALEYAKGKIKISPSDS